MCCSFTHFLLLSVYVLLYLSVTLINLKVVFIQYINNLVLWYATAFMHLLLL